MSYTQTLHGEAYYSGSVSVSYPASQNGGSTSASYSGSVPVDINVTVDTAPFDGSVLNCNRQLDVLAGSVVAMNSAQCAAINESGNAISDHVTNGFFTMIKSELSQNMASLFSKINSGLGLILEKTKQVKKQQQVMESDYSRTKARYVKLFNDLDEECRKRVLELDRKAFELSKEVQHEQISDNQTKQVSNTYTEMNDGCIVNQQLSTACIRSKTGNVIQDLAKNVEQQLVYSSKVNSILYNKPVNKIESICIPVLFTEQSSLDSAEEKTTSCYAGSHFDEGKKDYIDSTVSNYFNSTVGNWKSPEKNDEELLNSSFNSLAEKMISETDQNSNTDSKRVYDMIMKLRGQSTILVNSKN
ncbi:MAG: hypothetical protein WCQ67_08815 [Treponema sp.]